MVVHVQLSYVLVVSEFVFKRIRVSLVERGHRNLAQWDNLSAQVCHRWVSFLVQDLKVEQ